MSGARHPVTTIPAPAAWAPYLINGDSSGLAPGERDQVDAWLAREGVEILDVRRDESGEPFESYYSPAWRILAPETGLEGGETLDYLARELTIDLDSEDSAA